MCTDDDKTNVPSKCAAGITPQAQIDTLQGQLQADALVAKVYPETPLQAYQNYTAQVKGSPMETLVRPDHMPASLRVKLKDPTTQNIASIISEYSNSPGVESVSDQRKLLQPLFKLFNGMTVAASVVAAVMVGLALMLIVNTVRLSAFSRRRETGIMRLVGASNFYIRLPFLMEGAVAGLAGVAMAGVGVVGVKFFLIDKVLAPSFQFTSFVGWSSVVVVMLWLLPIGLLMSVGASALSLRKYLKV
jgi:cell division transport system permease protein